MALHPDFPRSPYEPLLPSVRWFPAAEELRANAYEKLLPPLVAMVRDEVTAWRSEGYAGASTTSRDLLRWWFETDHALLPFQGPLCGSLRNELERCVRQARTLPMPTIVELHGDR